VRLATGLASRSQVGWHRSRSGPNRQGKIRRWMRDSVLQLLLSAAIQICGCIGIGRLGCCGGICGFRLRWGGRRRCWGGRTSLFSDPPEQLMIPDWYPSSPTGPGQLTGSRLVYSRQAAIPRSPDRLKQARTGSSGFANIASRTGSAAQPRMKGHRETQKQSCGLHIPIAIFANTHEAIG